MDSYYRAFKVENLFLTQEDGTVQKAYHVKIKNLELIEKSGVQVIWQTGAFYYEKMLEETQDRKPENLQIHKHPVPNLQRRKAKGVN